MVDIQLASQAINTLARFSVAFARRLPVARQVGLRTIRNTQDQRGFFYHWDLEWKRVKVPMMDWGKATMFSALTNLLVQLSDKTQSCAETGTPRNGNEQGADRDAVPD